jgi:hypothetical protein
MGNTQDSGTVTPKSPVDSRSDDPNFLVCVALTYLGLPPGLWRTVVNAMLEALSAEYRSSHGEARGSKEFEAWKRVFQGWDAFNKFKAVIVFLGESRVGPMILKNAVARAARERVLAVLARAGISALRITGASQIIRKVNVYLELAWLTGCAAYCGEMAAVNAIIDFSVTAAQAVADFVQGVSQVTQAIVTAVLVRPVLVARAKMDPSNWDTTPIGSAALALRLLGGSLWSKLQPDSADAFLANLMKPISTFGFPASVIEEIATAMTNTVNARGGVQSMVLITPDVLLGLSAIYFVQFLKDWGVLKFIREPETVADEAISGQGN